MSSFDIGGVEVAVEKSLPELQRELDIQVFYVRRHGVLELGQNPWWESLRCLCINRPDVVITSLWSAHLFGFIFKLFGVKWVCFIHNAGVTHFIDNIICKFSILLSDAVAVDSHRTRDFVISVKRSVRVHVIPYIFRTNESNLPHPKILDSFIFVGRNSQQKRLDIVAKFLRYVLTHLENSSCQLIISGVVPAYAEELVTDFPHRTVIKNNLRNEDVINQLVCSENFVVLSDYEGFCMAAYEAVQARCNIIYRDVGEISSYVNQEQSFLVRDISNFHDEFLEWYSKKDSVRDNNNAKYSSRPNDANTYVMRYLELIKSI